MNYGPKGMSKLKKKQNKTIVLIFDWEGKIVNLVGKDIVKGVSYTAFFTGWKIKF